MRVLVTGGAGFIGSHVVDELLAHGHDVAVIDNLCTGRRENVDPRARLYELDIREPAIAEVFARERPQIVSHHAAQMDVRRSTAEPLYDAEVNILGSINLLWQAVKFGVRKFIYISSGGAVYGEPEYMPVDEIHPIRPLCEYGASKHAVEHYVELYCATRGLDYTILRYPNVYGPRQNPAGEAGVVAVFASRMIADESCTINGDGDQERDFVYVSDCAQANLLVLEEAGSRQVYNLGWGEPVSVNEIFRCLAGLTGYTRSPIHGPPKPGETYRIYLSAARASAELGWRPTVSLQEGLARTVDYFRRLGHRHGKGHR